MTVPLSNLTATWATSASSVNTAIGLNVTDTLSAANAKLLDLKVNGTSKFSVDKTGNVNITGIVTSNTKPPTSFVVAWILS